MVVVPSGRWVRMIAPAVALVSVALAGCLGGDEPTPLDVAPTPVEAAPDLAPLPDEIHDEKAVPAGVDPFNFAMMDICSQSVSTCFRYPFELAEGNNSTFAPVRVEASLAWMTPANDFDLYLFRDGAQVTSDGATPPGNSEAISHDIEEPGAYEVIVVAWAVAVDTFTLDVTFARG